MMEREFTPRVSGLIAMAVILGSACDLQWEDTRRLEVCSGVTLSLE